MRGFSFKDSPERASSLQGFPERVIEAEFGC